MTKHFQEYVKISILASLTNIESRDHVWLTAPVTNMFEILSVASENKNISTNTESNQHNLPIMLLYYTSFVQGTYEVKR